MNSDQEKYKISMKLYPHFGFKSMCEVWQCFSPDKVGNMIFYNNCCRIIHINASNNMYCDFIIYGDNNRPVMYNYGMPENVKCFKVSLNITELLTNINKEKKGDPFYMEIDSPVNPLSSFPIIVGCRPDDRGLTRLPGSPTPCDSNVNYYDYYHNFYDKMAPVAKESLITFHGMYAKSKAGKYNYITLSMDEEGLVTYDNVHEIDNYNQGKSQNNRTEGSIIMNEFYNRDALTLPVTPVSYTLDVKQLSWICKIKNLNADGCVNIYMAPNKMPLVITTNIVNYGLAIFTMASFNSQRSAQSF